MLQNQELMVHKILEDNKAKLHEVCRAHLEDLKNVDNLLGKTVKIGCLDSSCKIF